MWEQLLVLWERPVWEHEARTDGGRAASADETDADETADDAN